jgi:putative peptide zinc metalloprotease protein
MSTALNAQPRLRTDLIISRQGSPEKLAVVIKDPITGRFFRFRETEAYILQHLRGVGSTEEIRRQVEEEFGASLPEATIDQFLAGLGRVGLLQQPLQDSPVVSPRSPGRIRGNAFYLRFNAFNPNRLLDRLAQKLGLLFTPSFVFSSAILIFLAACVTAANWFEIGRDLPRLYSLQSLFVAYLTMLGVITAHEFAHGLTCKHFGGNVREMGFMLLYFQPAFYCNVSDAWLFPEKYKRLWVTFAGAYFEIFVWALATVVWRLTEPSTLVNYMALVVMATSGIKTLFNLNPLIKLDGYYLLSDWLDIPNLRARSFGYLGYWARRVWGSAAKRFQNATSREKRIYFLYGVLAWCYSFWLLSFVLLYFGGFLVGRYQAWGFVLFAVLLLGIFQHPLKKLLRGDADRSNLHATMNNWGKRLLRLGIAAGILAGTFLFRMELRVSAPFLVLPLHNADVRAEVEGIIQEIYADEGQSVQKGAPIVMLSDRNCRAELRKIKAEIEERQARLRLLKAGTRPEEIELARTLLSKAEERVAYATNLLHMQQTLFDEKLISKKEVEDARETVAVRRKEVQEGIDKLNLLRAGSRLEEIEATEAEIARLQAHHQYLDEQLRLLKVASPIEGVITTHKLKDKIGQAVKQGDLIAKVHAMRTVIVEMAVPEKEIADVRIGAVIMLKARAYPQRSFEGRVTAIAPIANEPAELRTERTVRVTTQLDNTDLLLKPEMTGHAKIYCGERRLIDLITRRFIRFLKVEFWSWW